MLPTKLLPERQGWGQPGFHAKIRAWEQPVEVATQEFLGCTAEGKAEKDMGCIICCWASTDLGGLLFHSSHAVRSVLCLLNIL